MSPQDCDPPKLLILPEDRSPEARICTLAHPRTSKPSRYFFDPRKGIYEFTKAAAPRRAYRSWLIGRQTVSAKENVVAEESPVQPSGSTKHAQDCVDNHKVPTSRELGTGESTSISDGYVIKNAELLIATPIDYLFLLLPSFASSPSLKSPSSKGLFLSADDLLEKLFDNSKHISQLLDHEPTRKALEDRMAAVCDTVDAGDEKMYKLNDERLLNELMLKARNMIANGLPTSMEERFIRKALESPIVPIKHEESTVSERNTSQVDTPLSESISSDSQTTAQTSVLTNSSASSVDTEIPIPDGSNPAASESELYGLLRMRTALFYMTSAYIAPSLAASLSSLLAGESSPINFKPLNERLYYIAKLRADALAARSLGDFSRKRNAFEEDEAAESRAEKKRRKEEEEKKKKAGEPRSLRDLKKVDTSGMKKMSDFFGKKVAAKK